MKYFIFAFFASLTSAPVMTQVTETPAIEGKTQQTPATAANGPATFTCTQGKMTRTLEIIYSNPNSKTPCKVNYVKDAATGESTVLFSAENETGYCESKAESCI